MREERGWVCVSLLFATPFAYSVCPLCGSRTPSPSSPSLWVWLNSHALGAQGHSELLFHIHMATAECVRPWQPWEATLSVWTRICFKSRRMTLSCLRNTIAQGIPSCPSFIHVSFSALAKHLCCKWWHIKKGKERTSHVPFPLNSLFLPYLPVNWRWRHVCLSKSEIKIVD